MPDGEKTRTKFEAGKTQEAGFQLPKVDWLNQVKNDWDKLLYKSALDWKEKKFPEEVEKILVDASDQSLDATAGNWISFLNFEKEWNM